MNVCKSKERSWGWKHDSQNPVRHWQKSQCAPWSLPQPGSTAAQRDGEQSALQLGTDRGVPQAGTPTAGVWTRPHQCATAQTTENHAGTNRAAGLTSATGAEH